MWLLFSLTLPHSTVGWSAECECDISWPYLLFYIDSHSENIKTIFLSETTRPRALLIGKSHHLVDDI